MISEDYAWLRLHLTPGLGNTGLIRLTKAFGGAEAILAAGPAAWVEKAGVRLERTGLDAWSLHARGEGEPPVPGTVLSLEASRFDPACSGDMLPVEVFHRASQHAALGVSGEDTPSSWRARCDLHLEES